MKTASVPFFFCAAWFLTPSPVLAGAPRQDYVDGCQSVDGRFVVVAERVGSTPKDLKAGKWTFRWTDTKTNQTHTGDLVGLPAVGSFAHLFIAPDGETFAAWNPFAYAPGQPTPLQGLANGGKFADKGDPNWADHPAFAHRLVIYRKTGEIVRTFAVKDLLNAEELKQAYNVFQSIRWVAEYPGLTFGSAPRVGYGTYRISPDYTVLEFKARPVGKNPSRTIRVDLTTGKLLDSSAPLDEVKTPVRPFQGPDRITQNEQYLWQPSLDPVRVAGVLKSPQK